MVYGDQQLNGSSNFLVGLAIDQTSQNYGGNYTTYLWVLSLRNPGASPSWSNSTQYWSANMGGGYWEGTFTFDFRNGATAKDVAAAYMNVGHDGNGFRPGFPNYGSLDTNHSGVGDGTVTVWVDAPRIPKVPVMSTAAPTASQITPNSALISWQAATDNRGAGIDQYLLRVSKNSNPEQQPFTDYPVGGSTLSKALTGLDPSTTYYMQVYPHNSQGYGLPTSKGSFTTLAAAKISDDGAFGNADIFISRSGQWVPATLVISKAGAWVNTQ